MQTSVFLPRLELSMENVRVVGVQVRVGDHIAEGQPLIEVESEKAVQSVPSPKAGFVRRLLVSTDDQISENALICVLTDTAEEPWQAPTVFPRLADRSPDSPLTGTFTPVSRASPTNGLESEGIKASPAARKLAKDLGLSLGTLTGSGPGGRITVEDVQRANSPGEAARSEPGWELLEPRRLALIAQMERSLAEVPQFHVARQLQVDSLLAKVEGFSFTVHLVRCVAFALVKHPALRTILRGDRVRVAPVSVAVAMDNSRGLVAPALRQADLQSLALIAATIKRLRAHAEAGTLRREELEDAPFAISNLGMFNVDFFNAFVFHGQTAVLGVGRAVEGRAWFSLAADHRLVDGVEAARFLDTLQSEIATA